MLTGHGCYREYLHKYKHLEKPFCLYYPHRIENARHDLMECIRFKEKRTKILALLNDPLTPRVLVKFMIASEVAWNKTAKIIGNIMERLRSDAERNRKVNP